MCGIYGSTLHYSSSQVDEKLQVTAFRGPDNQSFSHLEIGGGTLVLGHNRLAIQDLEERSNQPFSYLDKVVTVYNGEIYNFKILKNELKSKGYVFNTESDTEVLCALYLEYGTLCVNYLEGMFAIVIFDKRDNTLFGARDRLGKKPFYYYHKGTDFEFASQLASIKLYNERLTISEESIEHYLAWNSVPDPKSIYNEVKKLKAAHYFVYDLKSGEIEVQKYWDGISFSNYNFKGSYEQSVTELEEILKTCVSQRMISDVPLGVFLSGGVDSSLVTALAQDNSNGSINTFSIKFNNAKFDESVYAQQVADHLQTNHHVFECDVNEGLNLIENFTDFYDEPFADSSAIPSMLLAQKTKENVTVALSGDGGDESFIGYTRYNWISQFEKLFKVPYFLRNTGSEVLNILPSYKLKVMAKALKLRTIEDLYLASMTNVDTSYINLKSNIFDYSEVEAFKQSEKPLLEKVSDFDLQTYLNWDINTKVDRASMAFSLEVRAPLLDRRVVEYAQKIPTSYKSDNGVQKRILKDILYKYVPKQIFDRPKSGFSIPFEHWFRNEMKDLVLTELSYKELQDIPCINPDKVHLMINQHMNNEWNRSPIIWKLLVLKKWLKSN